MPNSTESTPEAQVPGSLQGTEPKPEHQICGPDGVSLTPDSQAARAQQQQAAPPAQAPVPEAQADAAGNGEAFDETGGEDTATDEVDLDEEEEGEE